MEYDRWGGRSVHFGGSISLLNKTSLVLFDRNVMPILTLMMFLGMLSYHFFASISKEEVAYCNMTEQGHIQLR